MKISKNVVFGEIASLKKRKIVRALKRKKFIFDVFVITIPKNNNGILEIYPAYVLYQEVFEDISKYIIGIAKGKDEAYDMVSSFVMECYNTTGSFAVKDYFMRGNKGWYI